jgi:hypothetical protein
LSNSKYNQAMLKFDNMMSWNTYSVCSG